MRNISEVKHKWKNLSAVPKSTYSDFRKSQNKTRGGQPPPTPSNEIMETINLFKDTASFRSLEGVSTFNNELNVSTSAGRTIID